MKKEKFCLMLMFIAFFAGMLSLTGCQHKRYEKEECLYCQGTIECAECQGTGLLDSPPGAYCEYCKASGYCSRCVGSVITNRLEDCKGMYCKGGVCCVCKGCGLLDTRGYLELGHTECYVPASAPVYSPIISRRLCYACNGSGRCSLCRYGRRLIVEEEPHHEEKVPNEEEKVNEAQETRVRTSAGTI